MKSDTTYTMHYSDFVGVDASSDPRAVARNRLAYSVNMWRDYESEQGLAVETFPGFRRVAQALGRNSIGAEFGAVHGLYHFRSKGGVDYVVVHAGTRLYSFKSEDLADGKYLTAEQRGVILSIRLSDSDSTGFVFNNNLFILDGSNMYSISGVAEGGADEVVMASEIGGYVPTTYYYGKPYEQRNMLSDYAYEIIESERYKTENVKANWSMFMNYNSDSTICYVYGFNEHHGMSRININVARVDGLSTAKPLTICEGAFGGQEHITSVDLRAKERISLEKGCFAGCTNLKKVQIYIDGAPDGTALTVASDAFENCPLLDQIDVYYTTTDAQSYVFTATNDKSIVVTKVVSGDPMYNYEPEYYFDVRISPIYEVAQGVISADNVYTGNDIFVGYESEPADIGGETVDVVKYVYLLRSELRCPIKFKDDGTVDEFKKDEEGNEELSAVKLLLKLYSSHFSTVENVSNFLEGTLGYREDARDAIRRCTKCAVYDGRIFLTGNPALPNTVFYSHRNLTGANDPTYFGVYNYFNDGDGNTPNVDLLSTPSMLMVIKQNTTQEGSVYYHVGADNADESSKNLVPRIYPATTGAAGLGSAADLLPGCCACNFLDDPVFLSKRGLEAVGKQTVNLERTLTHRSSNVDRLLIREDLGRASLAEWKGYLVICCDGRIYLADSRHLSQHSDGSYQYEWFYLEGIGTYDSYDLRYEYWGDTWPLIEPDGLEALTLDDYLTLNGERVGDVYSLKRSSEPVYESDVMSVSVFYPGHDEAVIDIYYVEVDGKKYLVGNKGGELLGVGAFYGANKVLSVADRLIFGTPHGDICIVNTDKRGIPVGERAVDPDKIDRSYYTFNGIAYLSGCSVRLDDCDKKSLTKRTVCGSVTARFKMMPGSYCQAMVSLNGRDWSRLGEAFSSRFDFADIDFGNFSFAENENNVVVFPELTRGWINKQYYFYSDKFEAPFGLYELSYFYQTAGRIRY